LLKRQPAVRLAAAGIHRHVVIHGFHLSDD
jgi:hypothetical protein